MTFGSWSSSHDGPETHLAAPLADEVGDVLFGRLPRLDDGGRERLGEDLLGLLDRLAHLRDLGGRLAAAEGDQERLGRDQPLRVVGPDRVAQPLQVAGRQAVGERLVARLSTAISLGCTSRSRPSAPGPRPPCRRERPACRAPTSRRRPCRSSRRRRRSRARSPLSTKRHAARPTAWSAATSKATGSTVPSRVTTSHESTLARRNAASEISAPCAPCARADLQGRDRTRGRRGRSSAAPSAAAGGADRLEQRENERGEPHARLTLAGWTQL